MNFNLKYMLCIVSLITMHTQYSAQQGKMVQRVLEAIEKHCKTYRSGKNGCSCANCKTTDLQI